MCGGRSRSVMLLEGQERAVDCHCLTVSAFLLAILEDGRFVDADHVTYRAANSAATEVASQMGLATLFALVGVVAGIQPGSLPGDWRSGVWAWWALTMTERGITAAFGKGRVVVVVVWGAPSRDDVLQHRHCVAIHFGDVEVENVEGLVLWRTPGSCE